MPPSIDASVFAAAKRGDPAAWRAIVDAYSGVVWAVTRSLGVREPDRSDVYQMVFLKLTQHLGSIRDLKALPAWLSVVTRRECLDLFRSRDRQPFPSETLGDVVDSSAATEESVVVADEHRAVVDGFRRLDERCQRLLSLVVAEPGLSYAEVATALGMPIGSIGATRRRCLDKLARTPEVAGLGLTSWSRENE